MEDPKEPNRTMFTEYFGENTITYSERCDGG